MATKLEAAEALLAEVIGPHSPAYVDQSTKQTNALLAIALVLLDNAQAARGRG